MLASLWAGVRELLNSSAVYRARLDEWAEPPLGMGAGPESDISLSVSVSSLRSWWEWAWRGRDRWEEQRALRLQARLAGLELRCLLILEAAQPQHRVHRTVQEPEAGPTQP